MKKLSRVLAIALIAVLTLVPVMAQAATVKAIAPAKYTFNKGFDLELTKLTPRTLYTYEAKLTDTSSFFAAAPITERNSIYVTTETYTFNAFRKVSLNYGTSYEVTVSLFDFAGSLESTDTMTFTTSAMTEKNEEQAQMNNQKVAVPYTYAVSIDGAALDEKSAINMTRGAKVTIGASISAFYDITCTSENSAPLGFNTSNMLGDNSTPLKAEVDYTLTPHTNNTFTISFTDAFINKLPAGKSTLNISFLRKLITIKLEK